LQHSSIYRRRCGQDEVIFVRANVLPLIVSVITLLIVVVAWILVLL